MVEVVTSQKILDKRVLLRYDIDVLALDKPVIGDDFRLKAGLPTLNLCLEDGQSVVMMGHIQRPGGRVVEALRVAPIEEWFRIHGYSEYLKSGKLRLLENLRFDPREEAKDPGYARELAEMGDFFVNEAFAAHNPAVSTTVLPTLLPHVAGLRFAKEVEILSGVRNNPKKPFVVIMGGAKVSDKLPVIEVLAKKADAVLVGGRLIHEIREQNLQLPANVLVGKLKEDGFDIAEETTSAWSGLISKAAMIVWNGPLGKFEDPKNDQSAKIAKVILDSGAEIVVGGGDTINLLGSLGLLGVYEEKGFVSVGGGAMLKFLTDGILPMIEALT